LDWKLKGLVAFLIVKSDWGATNPTLTPTISPNTSNQNFEIAILLNVVERYGIFVSEDDTPPTDLRVRAVSYTPRAYKDFIESIFVETFKRAHSIGN
jgi:hypothetical protein